VTDAAELGRVTDVFEAKYDGFMSWFSGLIRVAAGPRTGDVRSSDRQLLGAHTPRLSCVRARRLALNLTTLCAAHHQRGVHTGLIRISGHAPDALVFELPVGRSASGDRVL
jgi:hypothetical protein